MVNKGGTIFNHGQISKSNILKKEREGWFIFIKLNKLLLCYANRVVYLSKIGALCLLPKIF